MKNSGFFSCDSGAKVLRRFFTSEDSKDNLAAIFEANLKLIIEIWLVLINLTFNRGYHSLRSLHSHDYFLVF